MINIVFPFFVGLFLMYTSTTGNALQHGSQHYHGRYYLHEVLDFQPIINKLKSATLSNIDSTILLKTTTHLSDAYMYYQLQIHPSRVTTISLADFHVLNIPFSASWAHTQWNLSTSSEFESRLNQIESAMIKIFEVIDKTKAILIYLPHIHFGSFMSTSIVKLINAEADRIIIAAIEGDKFCAHNFRDVIVIPYLSTYDFFSMYGTEKEKAQIQMTSNHYSTPRKFTVMFHGNMGRLNDGQYRGILCNALQEHFGTAASFHDINVAKKDSILSIFMDTYEDMRNSRYCLVLAGDSPTSRRIFDALSTGCTPIVLGMTMNHMPYPSIADNYENRSIHIIPNSLEHWSTHKDEFLKIVIDLTDGYSESQQINSNELFMKYMAYETGAVVNATINAVSLSSASIGGGGGGGINLCYKLRETLSFPI